MTGHAAGSTGRLKVALAATAGVAVLELAGGLRAGSLALMSDAAILAKIQTTAEQKINLAA